MENCASKWKTPQKHLWKYHPVKNLHYFMWPQKLKNLCAQWRRINYSSKNHHYSKMRLFKGRIPGQIDGCLLMNSPCYGYIIVADFSLYKNKIVLKIKNTSRPRTTSVTCHHVCGRWKLTSDLDPHSLVQIRLQLFKWGHFHIFSLSYNLTSDDLWPWYMTFDRMNIWR